jgi:hypothetical protein
MPDERRLLNRTGMNEQHSNRHCFRGSRPGYAQVIDDCGESWCADQWHDPGRSQLGDGPPKDSDVRVAVQASWIDDAVGKGRIIGSPLIWSDKDCDESKLDDLGLRIWLSREARSS